MAHQVIRIALPSPVHPYTASWPCHAHSPNKAPPKFIAVQHCLCFAVSLDELRGHVYRMARALSAFSLIPCSFNR